MAMSHTNGHITPKSQIEAIQTVPPYKVSDPRQVVKVAVKDPIGGSIFKGALNMIFYCNKSTEEKEDSGWHVAGWIKQSLGRALRDEPLISGRLRRGEDGVSGLEIVSNDSGVRLFEATLDVALLDFLALDSAHRDEAQLVYWKDIDEQNPQFSPLFYVQVTNFQCGGYSIGISCSLLLTDILMVNNFLQNWSKIHRDTLPKNKQSDQRPIFYLPNLKPPNANLNRSFPSACRPNLTQTLVYKITSTNEALDSRENLALFCLEESEKNLGISNVAKEFSLLVKESPDVIRVENWNKSEIGKHDFENGVKLNISSDLRDCFGMNGVSFSEGNKPETVSCWVGSADGIVQAIAIPSYNKLGDSTDLNILITTHSQNWID